MRCMIAKNWLERKTLHWIILPFVASNTKIYILCAYLPEGHAADIDKVAGSSRAGSTNIGVIILKKLLNLDPAIGQRGSTFRQFASDHVIAIRRHRYFHQNADYNDRNHQLYQGETLICLHRNFLVLRWQSMLNRGTER